MGDKLLLLLLLLLVMERCWQERPSPDAQGRLLGCTCVEMRSAGGGRRRAALSI